MEGLVLVSYVWMFSAMLSGASLLVTPTAAIIYRLGYNDTPGLVYGLIDGLQSASLMFMIIALVIFLRILKTDRVRQDAESDDDSE